MCPCDLHDYYQFLSQDVISGHLNLLHIYVQQAESLSPTLIINLTPSRCIYYSRCPHNIEWVFPETSDAPSYGRTFAHIFPPLQRGHMVIVHPHSLLLESSQNTLPLLFHPNSVEVHTLRRQVFRTYYPCMLLLVKQ